MFFYFGCLLSYIKLDVFILLASLFSTLIEPLVINTNIVKDLSNGKANEIIDPISLFISSLLDFILKYNRGF